MNSLAIPFILSICLVATYQTPLISCPKLPSNFLIAADKFKTTCGLPSARSYILSKFKAALYIEPLTETITTSRPFSIRVLACHVTEGSKKHQYRFEDTISIEKPTPWDLESCMATELTIWARLHSKKSMHAPTHITRLKDACGWELTFNVDSPGNYEADIMSTWLRGSIDSASETCEAKRHTQWEGGIPLQIPAYLRRGSPYMSCCDLCSMYERCAYWTMHGENKMNCFMYTNATTPWRIENNTASSHTAKNGHISRYPLSGVRKQEPQAMYLGGIVNSVDGWQSSWSECRGQAHVLNSPLSINVIGQPLVVEPNSKDLCIKGDGPGSWVRFDADCFTTQGELQQLTIGAVQMGTRVIAGEKWVEWYNDEFEALFYESRYNKAIQRFKWNPPKGWPGAKVSKSALIPPPWQKMPVCTLGDEIYPDSNLREFQMYPVSYQPGNQWISNFRWQGDLCDFEHYNRAQIRRSLASHGFQRILIGGDSVMGGLGQVIKWMTGVSSMSVTERWYSDSVRHMIQDVSENSKSAHLDIQGIECNLNEPDRCIKAVLRNQTQSVVVVNFGIQHLMWNQNLATMSDWLVRFEETFGLAKDLFKKGSRFVFVNSVAIHGFREPYCTTERAKRFSEVISTTVKRMGWEVVDAFNMTYLRPDLSVDGMHFGDSMNYMLAQVIFNIVMNVKDD